MLYSTGACCPLGMEGNSECFQYPHCVNISEKANDPTSSYSTRDDNGVYEADELSECTHWTFDNETKNVEVNAGDHTNQKRGLCEEHCYDQLGYGFPTWKKWLILSVIFLVQVSASINTSLYSDALSGISNEFNVPEQAAGYGAMIFLVVYAFGCVLWAPCSEELGRKPIIQASLLLVNVWQLPVALAPNLATVIVGRALGGLSSAGGSVSFGIIADMCEEDNQQFAVAFVVLSSVSGPVLGRIVGGFCQQYLHWRWCIWIQMTLGGVVQLLHLFLVPETRSTIMIEQIARTMRMTGENPTVYGSNELKSLRERFSASTWNRPLRMFLSEPVILTLSLLSGCNGLLVFMVSQELPSIYEQWGFEGEKRVSHSYLF